MFNKNADVKIDVKMTEKKNKPETEYTTTQLIIHPSLLSSP